MTDPPAAVVENMANRELELAVSLDLMNHGKLIDGVPIGPGHISEQAPAANRRRSGPGLAFRRRNPGNAP